MPQFSKHTPLTPSDISAARTRAAARIRAAKRAKAALPVGAIGKNDNFEYGFDGLKYYVTEGVLEEYVTNIHLTFDEAKQLFNALSWGDRSYKHQRVSSAIRAARKLKLTGDCLFWHLENEIH